MPMRYSFRRRRNNFGADECRCRISPLFTCLFGLCLWNGLLSVSAGGTRCLSLEITSCRSLNIHFAFERPLTNQPLKAQSSIVAW